MVRARGWENGFVKLWECRAVWGLWLWYGGAGGFGLSYGGAWGFGLGYGDGRTLD